MKKIEIEKDNYEIETSYFYYDCIINKKTSYVKNWLLQYEYSNRLLTFKKPKISLLDKIKKTIFDFLKRKINILRKNV